MRLLATVFALAGCVAASPDPGEVRLEGVEVARWPVVGAAQPRSESPAHYGPWANAVDFLCTDGTPVVAARAGRVVEVRAGSTTGCAEERCADLANFVIVDHGDGTEAHYWHLAHVDTLLDAELEAGAAVGTVGATGWATEPHLHFQIDDVDGSRPVAFETP